MSCGQDTLASVYPVVVRNKQELRRLLEVFESGQDRTLSMRQRLEASNQNLQDDIERLQVLINQEKQHMDGSVCDLWERRLRMLRSDVEWIQHVLETHLGIMYRMREKEREERKRLFESASKHINGTQEGAALEATMAKERNTLRETGDILTSMLHQGQGIVFNLVGQNVNLKNAQKKMLDFQGKLNVSGSLIGTIQRRHSVDRLLVYFGIILTLTVFATCYYFVHVRYPGAQPAAAAVL